MKKTNVIIIILTILVLGLTGYIVYDKVLDAEENNNYQKNNNTNQDDNKESTGDENNQITDKAINGAYDLLGLPRTNSDGNNLLNYYISNNDYNKYTSEIISYYANTWDDKSLFKKVSEEVMNSDACGSSGFCMSIAKEDAKKIFALYNFSGNFSDYFKATSQLKNEYIFIVTNTTVPAIFDSPNTNIKHDIDSYNMLGTDIGITDKQVITIVDENNSNKLKTISKTVNYEFKMNNEGNYYLYKVDVK